MSRQLGEPFQIVYTRCPILQRGALKASEEFRTKQPPGGLVDVVDCRGCFKGPWCDFSLFAAAESWRPGAARRRLSWKVNAWLNSWQGGVAGLLLLLRAWHVRIHVRWFVLFAALACGSCPPFALAVVVWPFFVCVRAPPKLCATHRVMLFCAADGQHMLGVRQGAWSLLECLKLRRQTLGEERRMISPRMRAERPRSNSIIRCEIWKQKKEEVLN